MYWFEYYYFTPIDVSIVLGLSPDWLIYDPKERGRGTQNNFKDEEMTI